VARAAKGNQIIVIMSTASINWDNMVYFINRNITTSLKASFTQGMVGDIKLSNFTPLRTVMLFMIAAMLFIIFAAGYGFVVGTITTFSDGSRATGVATGF